jgi:hypothetical protein
MARLIGPDEGSRLVYMTEGTALGTTAGLTVVFYEDPEGTVLANILTVGGGAIPGSALTVGEDSLIPLFQVPDDVDTLYAQAGSILLGWGPIVPVYARTDDRLDAAEAQLQLLPGQIAEAFLYTDAQIGELFPDGPMRFRFGTDLPADIQPGDFFIKYTPAP